MCDIPIDLKTDMNTQLSEQPSNLIWQDQGADNAEISPNFSFQNFESKKVEEVILIHTDSADPCQLSLAGWYPVFGSSGQVWEVLD